MAGSNVIDNRKYAMHHQRRAAKMNSAILHFVCSVVTLTVERRYGMERQILHIPLSHDSPISVSGAQWAAMNPIMGITAATAEPCSDIQLYYHLHFWHALKSDTLKTWISAFCKGYKIEIRCKSSSVHTSVQNLLRPVQSILMRFVCLFSESVSEIHIVPSRTPILLILIEDWSRSITFSIHPLTCINLIGRMASSPDGAKWGINSVAVPAMSHFMLTR